MVASNLKDLTGQKFGRLTVIERATNNKFGCAQWLCKCDCGNEVIVVGSNLRSNHTRSCGCLQKEKIRKMGYSKLKNIIGNKYGRLTVIERYSNSNARETRYLCKCDCGNIIIVHRQHLINGHTKSCGCLRIENNTTHNMCYTRLYGVWHGMEQRCCNKNNLQYKYYGARGITVCDEWKNNFQAFYDWAIQNGYDESAPRGQCTIDRINNDGNYEPSNCRWVTMKKQSSNKRTNRYITYNGETLTISEWATKIDVTVSKLRWRLKNGWSVERALEK